MTPLATVQAASAISRAINGQPEHVRRYLARVDERLAELPNDACRRGFLGDEIAKWQVRYARFGALVTAGGDPGDANAFDYIETIAALDRRLADYARAS
jgi:hypothetical protein